MAQPQASATKKSVGARRYPACRFPLSLPAVASRCSCPLWLRARCADARARVRACESNPRVQNKPLRNLPFGYPAKMDIYR